MYRDRRTGDHFVLKDAEKAMSDQPSPISYEL